MMTRRKNNSEFFIVQVILFPIMALVVPFLVWPIEYILPYPHIIEELAKLVFAFFIIKQNSVKEIGILSVLVGAAFALSETIFYAMNFMLLTTVGPYIIRFVVTTALHSGTLLLMAILMKKKRSLILVGFPVAVLLHYVYNLVVR